MTKKPLLLLGLLGALAVAGCGTPAKTTRDGGADVPADGESDRRDVATGEPATDGTVQRGTTPNGQSCAAGGECQSGYCADGVCCNSDCVDLCHSCKLSGSEGTCLAVVAGEPDQRGDCRDQGLLSCGTNGKCDGLGQCQFYAKGVICQAQRCSGSVMTNASTCDGAGSCKNGAQSDCAPFTCDTSTAACRQSCSGDAECTSGNFCDNASCGLLPPGASCGAAAQCKSGFCQQGVCCDKTCTGNCFSCNLTGSKGTCSPVPDGQDPLDQCAPNQKTSCQQDGFCDGTGKCRLWSAGTTCKDASCASGAKTLEARCDGFGLCGEGVIQSCSPYVCGSTVECGNSCTDDDGCTRPYTCQSGQCAKRPNGQACGSATECTSGFCEQGNCCATVCAAPCKSCSSGTCTNAQGGTDPKSECADDGVASCGNTGNCDGLGKCGLYSSGTLCKAPSCPATESTFTPAARCNGAGACIEAAASACNPYMCNGSSACYSTCTSGTQCTAGNVCTAGSCGPKPNGAVCTGGGECGSGICAQGVCCKTDCGGTCMSCAVSGSEGTCSAIPFGVAAPSGHCTDGGAPACGQNGKCDGKGACALYAAATQCVAPSCTAGTASSARTCNGSGVCGAATTTACSPYVCGATACKTSCAGTSDCVSPYTCQGTACVLKPNGAVCTAGTECTSGICAQGRCCSTTCSGCKSCAVAGAEGTCNNLAAGSTPNPASTCPASAKSACGLDGTCDGNGGCSKWSASTQCAAATCPNTGSVLTLARNCDGNGNCASPVTQACVPYMCNAAGAACLTTCTDSTQCTSGQSCVSGSCGLKISGSACSASVECQSNYCVDGVCCNDACVGACKSCKLSGKVGICAPVDPGTDPENECADETAATCGHDGTCDGNGACRKYPTGTECTSGGTCSGSSSIGPSTCQSGTCTAPAAVSCLAYACNAGACYTSCTSSAQCATGFVCTGTTCGMATNVKIQYWGGSSADRKWIHPRVKLFNLATTTVPLSEFTIRYWFSKEGATAIDWARDMIPVGEGNVTTSSKLGTGKTDVTADSYFDMGFTAGAGNLAGGTNVELQWGIYDKNWAVLTEANDYSFDTSGRTTYADWTKITVYRNGILVFGTEPN